MIKDLRERMEAQTEKIQEMFNKKVRRSNIQKEMNNTITEKKYNRRN